VQQIDPATVLASLSETLKTAWRVAAAHPITQMKLTTLQECVEQGHDFLSMEPGTLSNALGVRSHMAFVMFHARSANGAVLWPKEAKNKPPSFTPNAHCCHGFACHAAGPHKMVSLVDGPFGDVDARVALVGRRSGNDQCRNNNFAPDWFVPRFLQLTPTWMHAHVNGGGLLNCQVKTVRVGPTGRTGTTDNPRNGAFYGYRISAAEGDSSYSGIAAFAMVWLCGDPPNTQLCDVSGIPPVAFIV
jgi:hypothetical protein